MARALPRNDFFADLRNHIQRHCELVTTIFATLTSDQLCWQPAPNEWNILQCFDHLNLTHDFYIPKIDQALAQPVLVNSTNDSYKPSFWISTYMHFGFNPNYSIPAPPFVVPNLTLQRNVLGIYLEKQAQLLNRMNQSTHVDLTKTTLPLARGINLNLGDYLKILVYHDELHFHQARRIVSALATSSVA